MAEITTEQVWTELKKELFAVLGMVTAKGEARTVGIVYAVHDRKIYLSSKKTAWKVRHIQNNPNVSLTVPIAKRIPFLPMIKIPAATITFSGLGKIVSLENIGEEVLNALFRGLEKNDEILAESRVIEIEPVGEFITYGVGVSMMEMRDTELARGRAPVT